MSWWAPKGGCGVRRPFRFPRKVLKFAPAIGVGPVELPCTIYLYAGPHDRSVFPPSGAMAILTRAPGECPPSPCHSAERTVGHWFHACREGAMLAVRTMMILALAVSCTGIVRAQTPPATTAPPTAAPGVVSGGSNNVTIGNLPAARDGERTTEGGTVTGTSPDVYINGRPAVTTGDRTNCGGIVVGGGGGVFINGKPAGRTGDLTTGCGSK